MRNAFHASIRAARLALYELLKLLSSRSAGISSAAPTCSQMARRKVLKPLAGRLGSAKVTSSPGSMMLIWPGPISYSLGSRLTSGRLLPTSLNGLSPAPASVLMKAVKNDSTTAAVSSLSV